jgi:hypothetical protein
MTERFRPTSTKWNVLCAGPSSPHVTEADLLDGPLIAINRAIRTELPVWCWAAVDDPSSLYPWYPEAFEKRGLWYFTLDAWLWKLERLGLDLTRCFAMDTVPVELPDGRGTRVAIEDERGRKGTLPTIALVLGWLSARLRATEIRVLGADMRGEGSVWAPDTHPFRASREADLDRWQMERFLFARCIQNGKRQGTKIYRYHVQEPSLAA